MNAEAEQTKIDYSNWSQPQLVEEAKMLHRALHSLAQEAQADRLRLQILERTCDCRNRSHCGKWVILLLLASTVLACPTGTVPWEGNCAADPKAAIVINNSGLPSDEKPPTDKMPSWQREGVHVDEAKPGVEPSTGTAHDYGAEQEQR